MSNCEYSALLRITRDNVVIAITRDNFVIVAAINSVAIANKIRLNILSRWYSHQQNNGCALKQPGDNSKYLIIEQHLYKYKPVAQRQEMVSGTLALLSGLLG